MNQDLTDRIETICNSIYHASGACAGIMQLAMDAMPSESKRELSAINAIADMLEDVLSNAGEDLEQIERELRQS